MLTVLMRINQIIDAIEAAFRGGDVVIEDLLAILNTAHDSLHTLVHGQASLDFISRNSTNRNVP